MNTEQHHSTFIVRTLLSEDGVIGLNGYRYLLHADDSLMKFETKEVAAWFLTKNDINLEDIEIVNTVSGEIPNA